MDNWVRRVASSAGTARTNMRVGDYCVGLPERRTDRSVIGRLQQLTTTIETSVEILWLREQQLVA